MTEAIEQIAPPLPPARKDDDRSEARRPSPPTEEPRHTSPHPHKGGIVDVMA